MFSSAGPFPAEKPARTFSSSSAACVKVGPGRDDCGDRIWFELPLVAEKTPSEVYDKDEAFRRKANGASWFGGVSGRGLLLELLGLGLDENRWTDERSSNAPAAMGDRIEKASADLNA